MRGIVTRESVAISIFCLLLNGFNVAYVLRPEIKAYLYRQYWYSYVPDVHDLSPIVGSVASNYVWLGFAGVSIVFDVLILIGICQGAPELVDSGCLYHFVDLVADFVIGLASANYTLPRPHARSLQQPLRGPNCTDAAECRRTAAAANATNPNNTATNATNTGDTMPLPFTNDTGRRDLALPASGSGSDFSVFLRPPTVRQVLHFGYVLTRAAAKFEMLNTLNTLAAYLKGH